MMTKPNDDDIEMTAVSTNAPTVDNHSGESGHHCCHGHKHD